MEKRPDLNYGVTIASGGVLTGGELGYQEPAEVSETERLMSEFETHEAAESIFVQRYKEIAAGTKNPLVKFLLQLIISDEEKHHAVTCTLVSTLKGSLTWTRPEGAIRGLSDLGEEKQELLDLTEQFIRVERRGIKECKDLIKLSRNYYRGLFVLLLRCMVRDSEKHLKILEFLRQRLKGA